MDSADVKGELILNNIEGLTEWNIPDRFWEGRPEGLSAMLRVKNEGAFLEYAVASIIDWHDEVCIVMQGKQEDDTEAVAYRCANRWPGKVRVLHYPFDSIANGPGHDKQPRGSVYERVYFYNWCLAKTRFSFADKWDGDMIAHDWLGAKVRDLMKTYDGIWFKGLDLAGPDLKYQSAHAHTATEQRVHRVTDKTFYFTYTHCEHFSGTRLPEYLIKNGCKMQTVYAFIHLKWCKPSLRFSGVGWPEDWQTAHPYYREIWNRKKAAQPYRGPYPKAIQPYLDRLKAA